MSSPTFRVKHSRTPLPSSDDNSAQATDVLEELYQRPGFLLRRAHQIAVGIFTDECAHIGLTPPQHGILILLDRYPSLSQSDLSKALGFDRATVGQVIRGLETRGLVQRNTSTEDRRRMVLGLTTKGRRLIQRASPAISRISGRLLSPLLPAERDTFMRLLRRLTTALNTESRSPLSSLKLPGEIT